MRRSAACICRAGELTPQLAPTPAPPACCRRAGAQVAAHCLVRGWQPGIGALAGGSTTGPLQPAVRAPQLPPTVALPRPLPPHAAARSSKESSGVPPSSLDGFSFVFCLSVMLPSGSHCLLGACEQHRAACDARRGARPPHRPLPPSHFLRLPCHARWVHVGHYAVGGEKAQNILQKPQVGAPVGSLQQPVCCSFCLFHFLSGCVYRAEQGRHALQRPWAGCRCGCVGVGRGGARLPGAGAPADLRASTRP